MYVIALYCRRDLQSAKGFQDLQKFGFIKRVDKGEITTVKDLESSTTARSTTHKYVALRRSQTPPKFSDTKWQSRK